MSSLKKKLLIDILFVFPVLLLFFLFNVYPFIANTAYSLTRWDGMSKPVFIGIENFNRLFSEESFKNSIKNTLIFLVAGTFLINGLALFIAILLDIPRRNQGILRTIFYMPAVVSMASMSVVWTLIYHYNGLLNKILKAIGFEFLIKEWLGNFTTVIPSLIVILIWTGMGFSVVIFLNGLNSIPKELFEAAAIDGAGAWKKFKNITLPMLMTSITLVTFLSLTGMIKLFDLPYIMTNGGPGDGSKTLAILIYQQAFTNSNYGYASAGAVVLFAFAGVLSFIQISITRKMEVEV